MTPDLADLPRLLHVPEGEDDLHDHPFYRMAAFDGASVRAPQPDELQPLPPGSDVFVLPGRRAVGLNPETGGPEIFGGGLAVAAFAAPGYLRLCHPATAPMEGAEPLPLFAYAPVGYARGRLWTTTVRVDRSRRQDPRRFDLREIGRRASALVRSRPRNRLIAHLRHCAMTYGCRAAQNFFLGREECPLPTSQTCNATCAGCLSHQPPGGVPASHERIAFTPTPEEVAEVALIHIGRVARPVVSFGQGCEGEPLTVAEVLVEAVREVRRRTDRGTIHLNTNGSRPDAVTALCEAGLDSIRLSVNSFRPALYDAYFRPRGFTLEDVIASGRVVHESGGFVSVNLLVFPGVTDLPDDIEATVSALRRMGADLVQMRNLNMDPDLYLRAMGGPGTGLVAHGLAQTNETRPVGLIETMRRLRDAVPGLRFGYFNPPVRTLVRRRRAGRSRIHSPGMRGRPSPESPGLQTSS